MGRTAAVILGSVGSSFPLDCLETTGGAFL